MFQGFGCIFAVYPLVIATFLRFTGDNAVFYHTYRTSASNGIPSVSTIGIGMMQPFFGVSISVFMFNNFVWRPA